ncbi:MAG: SGNH/GDSL hydrolase family protein [Methyloceanibacter sp.]
MFTTYADRRTMLKGAMLGAAAFTLASRTGAADQPNKPNIVLLGDSAFDNGAYIGKGPDVVKQLNAVLPTGGNATLLAVDGSVTSGVGIQLGLAPSDATHLVVSAGGNDALHYSPILGEKVGSVAEALERLADVREAFTREYRLMLDKVQARGLPTAVCTIYEARFPDLKQRRQAAAGLTLFNDCITREAAARGLAVIDLRVICNDDEDLANPIEPSVIGGAKIANAIATFAGGYDFRTGRAEVFADGAAKI